MYVSKNKECQCDDTNKSCCGGNFFGSDSAGKSLFEFILGMYVFIHVLSTLKKVTFQSLITLKLFL